MLKFTHSAVTIVAGALAGVVMPPDPMPPSAWAASSFILPDGEHKGELIDLTRTPHLVEVIDSLGPDSADNEIVVMKSAQSAFTTALQILVGHSIDTDPCDMMIVQPTDSALTDFNSQKLGRAIELSREAGSREKRKTWGLKVRPQTAKSGTASTTYEKKFPGGAAFLALATSSADLRSKTVKKALLDEIDEYPDDLNEQGDPLDMVEARQISFLRSATWKRAAFSTPTVKGASKIEAKHAGGDQRRWTMICPHCGDRELRFEFGKNFIFERVFPYKAHYVAPCCGGIIEGAQKYATYLTGRWEPTAPAPGKYRSYHFDAFASPFVPFEDIARKFVEAGEDQSKLKTFYNLTLGLPFEIRGDAPEYARLMERREDYARGKIPADGLLLVAGCDVQHTGIWFEIVAYAPDAQSWSIDHGFIPGDTTDPERDAFLELVKVYDRHFPDAFGGLRQIDAFAIDAGDGGRANQVYAWTRNRHRAFAVKGMPGWTFPAIGTPTRVSVNLKGKKIKGGAMLWPVGGWALKATYYANLRKDGRKAGAEVDPPGYCHHHGECDEQYFRQQTAEYLKTVSVRGRSSRIWQESGPNHLLDCRVYAVAMAEYLGLTRMTDEQWHALRRMRGVPAALKQPDLLAPDSVKLAASDKNAAPAVKPALLDKRKRKHHRMVNRGIA